jgi:hypothetical protein
MCGDPEIEGKLSESDVLFIGIGHRHVDEEFLAPYWDCLKRLGYRDVLIEFPADLQDNLDMFLQSGDLKYLPEYARAYMHARRKAFQSITEHGFQVHGVEIPSVRSIRINNIDDAQRRENHLALQHLEKIREARASKAKVVSLIGMDHVASSWSLRTVMDQVKSHYSAMSLRLENQKYLPQSKDKPALDDVERMHALIKRIEAGTLRRPALVDAKSIDSNARFLDGWSCKVGNRSYVPYTSLDLVLMIPNQD